MLEIPREEVKEKPRNIENITEITLIKTAKKDDEVKKEEPVINKYESVPNKGLKVVEFNFHESKKADEVKPFVTEQKNPFERLTPNPIEAALPKNTDYSLQVEQEEIEKKSKERIKKLKDLSIKLKTPNELDELEKTPAYVRRNVELTEVKHSSETEVSKYTLMENEDKKIEIKPNNSFLHTSVD